MEKRKTRGSTDESAVVKAAAWAWYQHGSGSEGNPTRECDIAFMTRNAPRPSRYKVEAAMRVAKDRRPNDHNHYNESKAVHNLSLLDAYEIRSISRRLDSLIEYSSADHGNKNSICRKEVFSDDDVNFIGMMRKKKRNMKKLVRGFWLRHAAAVCSTRENGVVNTTTRLGFQRSRPQLENHVPPVVMAATCGPLNIY